MEDTAHKEDLIAGASYKSVQIGFHQIATPEALSKPCDAHRLCKAPNVKTCNNENRKHFKPCKHQVYMHAQVSGGFRGVRGVQMHPLLAASNVFMRA